MVTTPYQDDVHASHTWCRTFPHDVTDAELIWHMDRLMRMITVVSGANWKLQLDNQLPELLRVGETYQIPAEYYHRLIKGDSDLIIQIVETESTHQESHLLHPQMHHADHAHLSPVVD